MRKIATEQDIYEAANFYKTWFYQMYSLTSDEERISVLNKEGFKNITLSTIRTVRMIAETTIKHESQSFNKSIRAYLDHVNIFTQNPSALQEFGLFLSKDQCYLLSLNKSSFKSVYAWVGTDGWVEV